jgi:hypothetical protein
MKKVVDEYFGVHDMYPEVEFIIWSFTSKVTAWAARQLNQPNTFIEFHFIKNGNQDSMKNMPMQDLKAWVHDLDMVVVMLKDPQKKKLVGFICSINKITNELAPMLIEKGFLMKNTKDKTSHNVVIK